MKGKLLTIIAILIISICIDVNVEALSTNATNGQPNFSSMKALFDKGLTTTEVSDEEIVTLYGKSNCNGSTCTVEYAGQYSKFEDALSHSVVCTGGEKYIKYQPGASGKTNLYDSSKSQNNYSGVVYWAEEYSVVCSSTNSGNDDTIELKDGTSGGSTSSGSTSSGSTSSGSTSGGSTSGGSTSGGSTSSGGTSGGSTSSGSASGGSSSSGSSAGASTNGEYSSSSTVNNETTGVNTYFFVLGIVAIISYIGMIFIKKLNLFKNV